jgi:hypothetical protein
MRSRFVPPLLRIVVCDDGRSLVTKAQSGKNRREGLLSSRHKTQYVQAIGETVRATSEKLAKTLPRYCAVLEASRYLSATQPQLNNSLIADRSNPASSVCRLPASTIAR